MRILHTAYLHGAKQVCQEDSASLLISKWGEGVEQRAVVQSLAANLDLGAGHGAIHLRVLEERVGVSVSRPAQKDPRLDREKISAAEFSRLLFSLFH